MTEEKLHMSKQKCRRMKVRQTEMDETQANTIPWKFILNKMRVNTSAVSFLRSAVGVHNPICNYLVCTFLLSHRENTFYFAFLVYIHAYTVCNAHTHTHRVYTVYIFFILN